MRALLCITALAQAFLHAPRRTIRRPAIRATASDDDEGFSIAGDEEEVSLDLVDLLRAPPDAAPNRNRSVDYFGESTSEQDQEWSEEAADLAATGESLEEALAALGGSRPADASAKVFCSRSLNLRGISVIGYDMDYTIVHYKWREWELLAYECTKRVLEEIGFPVADLEFDKDLACRGLVIDKDRGNFLKIDRHGFVRRAMHGDARLEGSELDALYGRTQVDLRSNRFSFLNTLFSVSEGVMYAQLVSKLDSGALFRDASPPFDASRVANYADLHRAVWNSNLQPFRRNLSGCASRTRRERSIRPKISRIDVDVTELENFKVWSGPPKPVVDFHTGTAR